MSTIQSLFEEAQLAEAAYANLWDSTLNQPITANDKVIAALKNEGMGESQAAEFVTHWKVISHQPNTASGFSATLFESLDHPGTYIYAVRGTEPATASDLLSADIYGIGGHGFAVYQALDMYNYWQSLTHTGNYKAATLQTAQSETNTLSTLWAATQGALALPGALAAYEAKKTELQNAGFFVDGGAVSNLVLGDSATLLSGTPLALGSGKIPAGSTIDVTGHSLGGHLGLILGRLAPNLVSSVETFNPPFFDPPTSDKRTEWFFSTLRQAEIAASGTSSIGLGFNNALNQNLNVPNDLVHLIGNVKPGSQVEIFSEGGSAATPIDAHSIKKIADSLAVHALFAQLDPSLNTSGLGAITDILKASSNIAANSLEAALAALGKIYGKNYASTETTRDTFYTNLYDLQAALSSTSAGLLGVVSLAGKTASDIATQAQTSLAYRYALANLNPFALTGDDALYAQHNAQGELDLYDPATGTGNLTDLYLQDRAAMLSWKMKYDTGAMDDDDFLFQSELLPTRTDKPYGEEWDSNNVSGDWHFVDRATLNDGSPLSLFIDGKGSSNLTADPDHQILFGSSAAETLIGLDAADHLYGGAGDDTLIGGTGNDYLEGGQGTDTYLFTSGDGYDTVLDSDGLGVIKIGDIQAQGSTGLEPDKWKMLGADLFIDTQNNITYSKSVANGETRLLIHKGDSNVVVKGWAEGELGIVLGGGALPPKPTLIGDFKKKIDDHGTPDTSDDTYVMTDGNYTPDGDEANALDLISGTDGNDVIDGKGGDDALSGMAGDDYILGGLGGDLIQGGLGKDTLNGGAGDDFIYGSSDEAINKPTDVNFIKPVNTHAYPQATGFNWTAGYDATYANGVPIGYHSAPRNRLADDQGNIIDGGAGDDFLAAGTGADYVYGGTDNDFIYGMDKDDVLFGDSGNDRIFGDGNKQSDSSVIWSLPENHGNDIIDGGDGNDYLLGQGKDDTIFGGANDDRIWGDDGAAELDVQWHGNDYIDAGDGNDEAVGGGKDDIIYGGAGNDTIYGDSSNIPDADHGGDYIDGGSGNDYLVGDGEKDEIYGGDGDDLLFGDSDQVAKAFHGDDYLDGGNGKDQLQGYGGNDLLLGGAEDDKLFGQEGNDTLNGDAGNDVLDGGEGDDTLYGGMGGDVLIGGAGNDTLSGSGDAAIGPDNLYVGGDTLEGGTGDDIYYATAGDFIVDEQGENGLMFGDGVSADGISMHLTAIGEPALMVQFSDGQTFFIKDGLTKKTIDHYILPDGTRISHADLVGNSLQTQVDLIASNGVAYGGVRNDTLAAVAGVGAILSGGKGEDTLKGNSGGDTLSGGAGNDSLEGGYGNDTYVFAKGFGQDTLDNSAGDYASATDTLRLQGIAPEELGASRSGDNLILAIGSDSILISSYFSDASHKIDQVVFDGGVAWDSATLESKIVMTTPGDDIVHGTAVSDILKGGDGNDQLFGEGGNDDLQGDAGNDALDGGAGNDALDGGMGNDILNGEAGADIYLFQKGLGQDQIAALEPSTDTDLDEIRLTDIQQSEVTFSRGNGASADSDLVIAVNDGSDKITVRGYFISNVQGSSDHIGKIVFGDGSFVDRAYVEALTDPGNGKEIHGDAGNNTITGTTGNDQLFGEGGNDILSGGERDDLLDGGIGNDNIAGGSGSDTYLFGRGAGKDRVDNYDAATSAKSDTVRLADDVKPEDVTLYRYSDDLVIVLDGSPTQMWVTGHFNPDGKHGIDRIAFKDTEWDTAAIAANVQAGTQNAMTGTAGGDTFSVDHPLDTITEAANGGTDTVNSWVSYALPKNVENLNLTGLFDIDGRGNPLNNVIRGNASNNLLDGGGMLNGWGNDGSDTLIGGAGDDTYYVTPSLDDVVVELPNEGNDTVIANFGGYTLADNVEKLIIHSNSYYPVTVTGNALDNVITGRSNAVAYIDQNGNFIGDSIDGGAGADVMTLAGGGTFYVDNVGDKVQTSGIHKVFSSADFVLPEFAGGHYPSISDLILMTDRGNINGTGNGGNNTIRGNNGDNILIGGAGDDKLIGIWGNDILIGGLGSDSYAAGGGGNTIIDNAASDGESTVDTLVIGGGGAMFQRDADDLIVSTGPDASVTVKNHFAADGSGRIDQVKFATTGTVWDSAQIAQNLTVLPQGTSNADTLTGTWAGDTLHGVEGDDAISGSDGSDRLFGDAGNDSLNGDAGNDLLDGGTGADKMLGGTGDDVYVIDNAGDVVTENANEGLDTVQSTITMTLAANVENLTLTGASAIDATGNALDNVLAGNSAANILTGGTGNDTYVFGKGSGQDTVNSYDATIGKIDSVQFDDTVVSSEVLASLLGNDLVLSIKGTSDTLTIQHYMDNDGASAYAVGQIKFQDGTIWDVAAVKAMVATNHAPELTTALPDQAAAQGSAFSYTVPSSVFTDPDAGDALSYSATLADGSALPSWLGFDAATLTFSGTPDTPGTISVRVTAKDTGGLTASDILDIAVSVNNLALNGTSGVDTLNGGAGDDTLKGLAGNDVLNGNAGNDRLDGGTGADKMLGGAGDDTYVVSISTDVITENTDDGMDSVESSVTHTLAANVENLTLTGTSAIKATGNTLDNILTGNSAANTLSGGTGADTLIGGAGNDTYVVDNILDVVTENLNEGTDLVRSGVTHTLADNVENLTLTGTAAIDATGNTLDNVLIGNSAVNTLTGGAGNDRLDGKTGADKMLGGTGDDTYVVNVSTDVITENTDEGMDSVESSVTHTLAANVENLTLTGTSATKATGNTLDNLLKGNSAGNSLTGAAGNDTLDGGAGNDTLDGGAGNDILNGGTGSDTYILGRGYGTDTVVENDATSGNTDIAQFLRGVATDQLWFSHVGNNLEVSIIGTSDKMVIKDWYLGTANHVEQFKTTDSAMTLLDSQVENLVNAMASFAPPAAGQTTLPPAYQTSLSPVIAANWQ